MLRGLGTALALCAAVSAGCGRRPAPVAAPASAAPPPAISWAGCAVVRVGPRCELGLDRKLVVWVAGDEGPRLIFAADGGPLASRAATAMQEGWQLTFEIPAGARRVAAARGGGGAIWTLALGEARLFPEIDALVAAGKRGDASAAARLRALRDDPDPELRMVADGGYGRVMLARGEMSEAEPALRRALEGARKAGRLSDEMRNGHTLFWALAEQLQRFADARVVLGSLTTARDRFPEGQAWYADGEAILAVETGDPRRALASNRTAERAWQRLGRSDFANDRAGDIAQILAGLGRHEEAVAIFERLPVKTDACAQASLLINRSEALIQAASRNTTMSQARVTAALAEEQRQTGRCPDPRRRQLATIHAARWALAIGDRSGADALIRRLRAEPNAHDTLLQALRVDLIGRWSLARGDARGALAAFNEQAAIARAGALPNESFRAEVGAGEALLALRRREDAVRRLTAAQALQQRMFEDVPFAEGRGEFLSSHDEGARHLVDALVDDGAADDAMAAARLARASEVSHAARLDRLSNLTGEQRRRWDDALAKYAGIRRAIEQEATEEWKLPAATLARARLDREHRAEEARTALDAAYRLLVAQPTVAQRTFPLRVGAIEIAFFQGAKSWIAFARTPAGTAARRFRDEALASNATAAAVLDTLSPQLQTAQRAILFTFGQSDRIDWHAVAWRGAPLITKMTVAYGLDLPGTTIEPDGDKGARRALVVADPARDLAAAGREGDLVGKALAGWQITRLDGRAATRDAVLAALPDTDLFHYAGHAEMAGPSGAASALVLTGGARAQIGDLQALPRLPRVVVLSACQAAATPSTMGLAQAMLAAGTRAVVAPTRVVADEFAQAFVGSLYEAIGARGTAALPEAFQRAAIGAAETDARSFRFLVQ